MKLLDRLFRMEAINGHGKCPTYMFRWTLLKFGAYGLYLHHFVGDDWSRDMHDHPKRFISIGLKADMSKKLRKASVNTKRRGSGRFLLRTFTASGCIPGTGFHGEATWDSDVADERKTCP